MDRNRSLLFSGDTLARGARGFVHRIIFFSLGKKRAAIAWETCPVGKVRKNRVKEQTAYECIRAAYSPTVDHYKYHLKR